MHVCILWSKDFYIYGKFYADRWMILNNDSFMMIYDLLMISNVWFILTIIIRYPLYWNYGHNLFLLKYFLKICTDKYLCTSWQPFLKKHGINSNIALNACSSSLKCSIWCSNGGQTTKLSCPNVLFQGSKCDSISIYLAHKIGNINQKH